MTADAPTRPDEVPARPAPHVSLRRVRMQEQVLHSLWFIPLCCVIAALLASRVALEIDAARKVGASVSGITDDRAAYGTLAGNVSAAMLTFLGVVFSTTLVAVQLAASQYSPRIVRVFVRSRLTQWTLGVFLATFVYALVSLFRVETTNEAFVPQITLYGLFALVAATVGMFVAYIHGMVHLIRVQYLLRITAMASHDALDDSFPDATAYQRATRPVPAPTPRPVRNAPAGRRHRGTARILQAVDVGGLAATAAAAGCWVQMRIAVGAHAGPGRVIAVVHGPNPHALSDDAIRAHLLFGSVRTTLQDPAFGLRQLVDTASRALSPAINDPTTGVQALERVVDLLERIADHPDPTGWYTDAAGVVRVRLVEQGFERLARLGFTEILRYGADAPQVTRTLLAVYDELEQQVSDERRPLIAELRVQCHEAIELSMPAPFVDQARRPDHDGLG